MKFELSESPNINTEKLANDARLSPEAARYLALKGYDTPEKISHLLYFQSFNLRKVTTMKDAYLFLNRLRKGIEEGEVITIYGDYDADGIMGTMILYMGIYRLMSAPGKTLHWFINNRFREGYGMNEKGVKRLLEEYPDTSLIVTVDNGIKAHDGIQYALDHGIDVIVSDHHGQSEGEELPNCPVVCEARLDEDMEAKESFCGAELARRLITELYKEMKKDILNRDFLKSLFAYSGLATITDSVPMNPANHYVAKTGILTIGQEKDMCWRILREETLPKRMDQDTIGYQYGPMINAPGRIEGNVDAAMRTFLASFRNDEDACRKAVKGMWSINNRRRELSLEDDKLAFASIADNGWENDKFILVADERFLEGINGLTAGHITETYKVPSIVLSPKDQEPDVFKGSARSVEGFNIFKALNQCRDLLLGFGGHPMAAGLSVKRENIGKLRERLKEIAENYVPDPEETFHVDFLIRPENITPQLVNDLSALMPFGPGLEKPSIGFTANIRSAHVMKEKHLKLDVDYSGKQPAEIVWWNSYQSWQKILAQNGGQIPKQVCCVGFPGYSIFQGRTKIQFMAETVGLKS